MISYFEKYKSKIEVTDKLDLCFIAFIVIPLIYWWYMQHLDPYIYVHTAAYETHEKED